MSTATVLRYRQKDGEERSIELEEAGFSCKDSFLLIETEDVIVRFQNPAECFEGAPKLQQVVDIYQHLEGYILNTCGQREDSSWTNFLWDVISKVYIHFNFFLKHMCDNCNISHQNLRF